MCTRIGLKFIVALRFGPLNNWVHGATYADHLRERTDPFGSFIAIEKRKPNTAKKKNWKKSC